jgi:hypothetical protein
MSLTPAALEELKVQTCLKVPNIGELPPVDHMLFTSNVCHKTGTKEGRMCLWIGHIRAREARVPLWACMVQGNRVQYMWGNYHIVTDRKNFELIAPFVIMDREQQKLAELDALIL